jgi:hypothetical protein
MGASSYEITVITTYPVVLEFVQHPFHATTYPTMPDATEDPAHGSDTPSNRANYMYIEDWVGETDSAWTNFQLGICRGPAYQVKLYVQPGDLLLNENFGRTKAEFIYNGNGSFLVMAQRVDYTAVEDVMNLFKIRLDAREEYRHVMIDYTVGIAETFEGNHTARKLLAEAITNKKKFKSCENTAKDTEE